MAPPNERKPRRHLREIDRPSTRTVTQTPGPVSTPATSAAPQRPRRPIPSGISPSPRAPSNEKHPSHVHPQGHTSHRITAALFRRPSEPPPSRSPPLPHSLAHADQGDRDVGGPDSPRDGALLDVVRLRWLRWCSMVAARRAESRQSRPTPGARRRALFASQGANGRGGVQPAPAASHEGIPPPPSPVGKI